MTKEIKWLSGGRQQGKTYQLIKDQHKEIERLTAESTEWESKCYKYQDIIDEIESIVYADVSNIDARISIQEVLDKLKEGK